MPRCPARVRGWLRLIDGERIAEGRRTPGIGKAARGSENCACSNPVPRGVRYIPSMPETRSVAYAPCPSREPRTCQNPPGPALSPRDVPRAADRTSTAIDLTGCRPPGSFPPGKARGMQTIPRRCFRPLAGREKETLRRPIPQEKGRLRSSRTWPGPGLPPGSTGPACSGNGMSRRPAAAVKGPFQGQPGLFEEHVTLRREAERVVCHAEKAGTGKGPRAEPGSGHPEPERRRFRCRTAAALSPQPQKRRVSLSSRPPSTRGRPPTPRSNRG